MINLFLLKNKDLSQWSQSLEQKCMSSGPDIPPDQGGKYESFTSYQLQADHRLFNHCMSM